MTTESTAKPGPRESPSEHRSLSDIRKRIAEHSEKDKSGKTPAAEAAPRATRADRERTGRPHGPSDAETRIAESVEGRRSMTVTDPRHDGPGKSGPGHEKHVGRPFSERHRSGELEPLTKGEIARRLKLAEQYRMRDKGDVARRLHLHKHRAHVTNVTNVVTNVTNIYGGHYHGWYVDHHYCGRISPHYLHGCFRFDYFGPFYYPNYCWYPRWCPWVSWCWYYQCSPLWDPRPVWCQPVVYVAAPRWVYYEVPVWVPLPEATCGTWVDVEPVEVGLQYDLQLLAVRLVDPGHPEEQLGPRYRVWFRNNTDRAITQPFDVFLFGSSDESLSGDLPQAGVRVTSIGAGEMQSVDVRLPVEAGAVGVDSAGTPPFSTLHALIDANREVPETSEANNGVRVAREDVLPVDPAAFELDPTAAAAGGEVVLAGEGFGPEPGQVLLHLGGIEMEAEILGWYDLGVRLKLPELPLAGPTRAELIVVRGDGAAANPLQITITPPQQGVPALPPPPETQQ